MRHDEGAPDALLPAARRAPARALAQRERSADNAERGHGAEDERGERGHRRGEHHHSPVDADLGEAWHVGGSSRDERSHGHPGDAEARGTGSQGEHERFGTVITRDARSAGAECGAYRQLARPGIEADERQRCHVHARDEEQQRRRAAHQPERARDATGDVVA